MCCWSRPFARPGLTGRYRGRRRRSDALGRCTIRARACWTWPWRSHSAGTACPAWACCGPSRRCSAGGLRPDGLPPHRHPRLGRTQGPGRDPLGPVPAADWTAAIEPGGEMHEGAWVAELDGRCRPNPHGGYQARGRPGLVDDRLPNDSGSQVGDVRRAESLAAWPRGVKRATRPSASRGGSARYAQWGLPDNLGGLTARPPSLKRHADRPLRG